MPAGSLLPLFSSPAGPGSSGASLGGGALGGAGLRKAPGPSGAFRLTEKFVLLLVFSAFITLCFGAIFFLPDSPKLLSNVFFHASHLQQQPSPPAQEEPQLPGASSSSSAAENLARIREDHERALREAKETLQKPPGKIRSDIDQDKSNFRQRAELPDLPFRKPVGVAGKEPADPLARQKRAKIKENGFGSPEPCQTFKNRVVLSVGPMLRKALSCTCFSFHNDIQVLLSTLEVMKSGEA
uniref:Uncharacterized protein n=1 Tax=Sphaerodactylus townsendi TaxID=933632 RepID=A0ACB8GC79_9SAUR